MLCILLPIIPIPVTKHTNSLSLTALSLRHIAKRENAMDRQTNKTTENFDKYYQMYFLQVTRFVAARIPHTYEAEDIAQDVFVRMLDYKELIREDTVKSFLFTIAFNLITDNLRRYYKKQEITSYIYDTVSSVTSQTYNTEEAVLYSDLLYHINRKIASFPLKRRNVYIMSFYKNMSIADIASELSVSYKTVENHLLTSRKMMRVFLKDCV